MKVQTITQKPTDHKEKKSQAMVVWDSLKWKRRQKNLSYLIGLGIKKPEFQFWLCFLEQVFFPLLGLWKMRRWDQEKDQD